MPQESGFTRFIPFKNRTSFSVSLGRSTLGDRFMLLEGRNLGEGDLEKGAA